MDQGVKRTQRDYSLTFKLAVVDQIEKVLDALQVRGLREGENPARWRGHLNTSCARRRSARLVSGNTSRPCAGKDVPALMNTLAQREELLPLPPACLSSPAPVRRWCALPRKTNLKPQG